MRLVSKGKLILLTECPAALVGYVKKWFGSAAMQKKAGIPYTKGIVIHKRRVVSLLQHYSSRITLDETTQKTYTAWWNSIPSRLGEHVRKYRGGYQARILEQAIASKSLGCFIDAGGGKTVIGLELAAHIGPTLLVVPPVIWNNAYIGTDTQPGDLRFYPNLKIADATGGHGATWKRTILESPADLYVVSPYSIGGIERELLDLPFAGIVWDESSLGRNPKSTRSRIMRSLGNKTDIKLALSADPCPNDVGEIWAQMDFLEEGLLGSYDSFGKKYGEKTRWGYDFHDIDLALDAVNEVRDRMIMIPQQRFWVEARKGKVNLHLKVRTVNLDSIERSKYDEMLEDYRIRYGREIDEVIDAEDDMSRRMKLRELTMGFCIDTERKKPHFFGGASKLKEIKRLIDSRPQEQWIIWTQFIPEGQLIIEALQGLGYSVTSLMGSDSGDPSQAAKDNLADFIDGKTQVLVSHTSSASHGVRMVNCRNMIFSSLTDDNDAVYQATRRIYRPPQKKDCYVYFLVAKDTVDEDILKGLRRKMEWRKALLKKLAA